MASDLQKTNWWEISAYKYVNDDIQKHVPHHINTIKLANVEIDRNASKPTPNPKCESHNMLVIEQQLQLVQERFNRWERTFSVNGDSSRWEEMPGAKYYPRYNWRAILPSPHDKWNHRIPVFGLDSDYLSGNTSSPGPKPAVNSYHISRPGPPTHRAFQPAGAFPAGIPTRRGTFGHPRTFPSSATAGYNTFQPPGHYQNGFPTGYGTFGPQVAFDTTTPAGYNTFQPLGTFQSPGAFHTGFPTGHGSFGPQGILPTSAPAGYNTFQSPGPFHTGFHTGHSTFGPQATFPASGQFGYGTSQPTTIFPATGPTGHDTFQPLVTFPSNAPINHRPVKPTRSLPTHDLAGNRAAEPTRQLPASAPSGQCPVEPTGSLPTNAPAGNCAPATTVPASAAGDPRLDESTGQLPANTATDPHPAEPTASLPTHAPAGNRAPEPSKKISSYIPSGERQIERDRHVAIAVPTDHGTSEPARRSHTDAHTSHQAVESTRSSPTDPHAVHRPSEAGPVPMGLFSTAGISSFSTRAVTSCELAKSLLADLAKVNYFSSSKKKTSEGTRDVSHQPIHREKKEPAVKAACDPFPVGRPAPKRGRSPPTMMVGEEEVAGLSVLETKAYKKQRVSARGPITKSSSPDAVSSGQRESIDVHLTSKKKHRTHVSSSLQEAKEVPVPKSAIRRLPIEERIHRERVWALSQSAHLRDSASRSERDFYLKECIEVQRQSLRLFYRSAAGQKTTEYNTDFSGFHHGGSGMKCSLCQTLFHDQYGSKQNPTASDFKIVAGASTFLRHALHRHTAYEPSVRCEEVLSMMARYQAFVECLKSNAFGADISDLEEMLRNKEVPEDEFLSLFASTKRET